ncbi:MAG: hypothetical protein ACRDT2_20160 [Natronosporangium sp.]
MTFPGHPRQRLFGDTRTSPAWRLTESRTVGDCVLIMIFQRVR